MFSLALPFLKFVVSSVYVLSSVRINLSNELKVPDWTETKASWKMEKPKKLYIPNSAKGKFQE